MTEPFLGQVEVFSFGFPPKGWALCQGQLLPINQNQALFALLGTTYGGNGQTNFGLPELRGRVPIGWGQGHGLSRYDLGQKGGEEGHTIINQEMGTHTHNWMVNTANPATANTAVPSTSVVLGNTTGVPQQGALFSLLLYTSGSPGGSLEGHSISFSGGNQPHENRMPYLALNFCIALIGIFPSRN